MSYECYPLLLNEHEAEVILDYQAARNRLAAARRANDGNEFSKPVIEAVNALKEAGRRLRAIDLVGVLAQVVGEFQRERAREVA